MNDEQILMFRKILFIRDYSKSSIKNYILAINKFNLWNVAENELNKDLLFKYVEYLKIKERAYSYIKISIMALKLFSQIMLGTSINNNVLKNIKGSSKLLDVPSVDEIKQVMIVIMSIKSLLCH